MVGFVLVTANYSVGELRNASSLGVLWPELDIMEVEDELESLRGGEDYDQYVHDVDQSGGGLTGQDFLLLLKRKLRRLDYSWT